ncbi:hypothetical protein VF10_31215 [Nostoc linckia z13]|nr:hypothetical protein VF10_31215 [Nostoc linckia z13]
MTKGFSSTFVDKQKLKLNPNTVWGKGKGERGKGKGFKYIRPIAQECKKHSCGQRDTSLSKQNSGVRSQNSE